MAWTGPGFVDHHAHLLRVAAREPAPYDVSEPGSIAEYHRSIAARWSTPMDELRPLGERPDLPGTLERGLQQAADLGIVQITEAGMTDWGYLAALQERRERGLLPLRVRILVASGIADPRTMQRTGDDALEVIGVKFYADGWLGPRTCALCAPFTDEDDNSGLLFLDADTLARRIDPFAEQGWTIATHAIGDRAIEAVLNAYQRVYGSDCAAAAPRIEHAQVLSQDLIDRMAGLGVVACIQPGFAVTDALSARQALGAERMEVSYRWDALHRAGVRLIGGSDFPIESLSPLDGLQRLVTGAAVGGDRVTEPFDLDFALGLMTDAEAGTVTLSDDPHDVERDGIYRLEVAGTAPNLDGGMTAGELG